MGMGRRVPCVPWEWGQGSRRAQRAARARLSTPRALGCPHGAQDCPCPGHWAVPTPGTGLSPWSTGLSLPWAQDCPHPGHRAVPTLVTRLPLSWALGCAHGAPGCPHTGHKTVPILGTGLSLSWAQGCPHGAQGCHTPSRASSPAHWETADGHGTGGTAPNLAPRGCGTALQIALGVGMAGCKEPGTPGAPGVLLPRTGAGGGLGSRGTRRTWGRWLSVHLFKASVCPF